MKLERGTVAFVLGSIRKVNCMFSIDLREEYFQFPVLLEYWLYLRFCLEGRVFQFRPLCFGLSTAMQGFTRVFALVLQGCVPSLLPG